MISFSNEISMEDLYEIKPLDIEDQEFEPINEEKVSRGKSFNRKKRDKIHESNIPSGMPRHWFRGKYHDDRDESWLKRKKKF